MKVKHITTTEYKPTPKELAKEIWEMDACQQCELLNYLGSIDKPHKISMQMQYMIDSGRLDEDGHFICRELSGYF